MSSRSSRKQKGVVIAAAIAMLLPIPGSCACLSHLASNDLSRLISVHDTLLKLGLGDTYISYFAKGAGDQGDPLGRVEAALCPFRPSLDSDHRRQVAVQAAVDSIYGGDAVGVWAASTNALYQVMMVRADPDALRRLQHSLEVARDALQARSDIPQVARNRAVEQLKDAMTLVARVDEATTENMASVPANFDPSVLFRSVDVE